MFPAAAYSDEDDMKLEKCVEKCTKELDRLSEMCSIGLRLLYPNQFNYFRSNQLRLLSKSCCSELWYIKKSWSFGIFNYSRAWKAVLDLRKKVEPAYYQIISKPAGFLELLLFSRISVKGIISVGDPLFQMMLFTDWKLMDGSFGCLKSMAPKTIARMPAKSDSSASPLTYRAGWVPAKYKSDSRSAVGNLPCENKKPLVPVLFDESVSKKTSSTVPVISQSGDNGNSGPYGSSMTAAKANCGVSKESILEIGKACNRLSGPEDTNNCQQHGTLTGGSHVARLQVPTAQEVACISAISMEKMPSAAVFVKCGDADESIMLAKRTSLQEQFILNHSGGDGGGDSPHSNRALRITPFAESTFTPRVPDLIESYPQHLRGLSVAPKNNNQQGASILMMYGGGGTNGVSIIDSGGAVNCTGNISLFTHLGPEPQGTKIFAANGEQMQSFGYGSISNPSLGLKMDGFFYIPCMQNKTIVSVAELNKLGYSVNFSQAGCSIRDERTWTRKLVGKARHINGQFELEYLNIHPASDGTLTLLWRVVCSKWTCWTKSLSQSSETLPQ